MFVGPDQGTHTVLSFIKWACTAPEEYSWAENAAALAAMGNAREARVNFILAADAEELD